MSLQKQFQASSVCSPITKQIADLVNNHNNLQRPIEPDKIILNRYLYIGMVSAKVIDIWACMEIRRAAFGFCEFRHLCVRPDHRRKGYARELLMRGFQEASEAGYFCVISSTVATNTPIVTLNEQTGFVRMFETTNPVSGHPLIFWRRELSNVPNDGNNSNQHIAGPEEACSRSIDVSTHGAGES